MTPPTDPTPASPAPRADQVEVRDRRVALLGNGRYTVMLTEAGSGYSRWRDLAVTRWREDPTRDHWGSYVLLRDVDSDACWSASPQPFGAQADAGQANLEDGCARFVQRSATLTTTLEVAVAADHDMELRRLTLRNTGTAPRTIELTSYAELVLGPAAADAGHPAFSKLFVQTHWQAQDGALLATRRKRAPAEPDIWAAHCIVCDAEHCMDAGVEYETDRARFLGRGNGLAQALAMQPGVALSNTVGTVLDPVFSLRSRVRVAAGESVQVDFWTAVADSREAVLAQVRAIRNADAGDRAIAGAPALATAARARSQLDAAQAQVCQDLLAPLLYADARWRAQPDSLRRGRGGAPVLWSKGISGDRPVVLLRIAHMDGLDRVQTLLRGQDCWRRHWLGVDVVVLNTASGADAKALQLRLESMQEAREALLNGEVEGEVEGARSQVFILRQDAIDQALADGLATVARVVLDAGSTGWAPREHAAVACRERKPEIVPTQNRPVDDEGTQAGASAEFDNGLGVFTAQGRDYTITLADGRCTPMPWINVVANPDFGFTVSAEGGGYAWSVNSQKNTLTPWRNDPVGDAPTEVLYLRDEDSGELWSATPAPIRVPGTVYQATHGKGWTRFRHEAHGIEVDLLQSVPVDDPVKLSRLRLRNRSGRTRHLSLTGHVEWALGGNGETSAPFVVTEQDDATGALFARNAWRAEFGDRVAFIDLGGMQTACSGDRTGFLGRYGSCRAPLALRGGPWPGRVGAGLDPCGALQTRVRLEAGAEVELVFMLGEAASAAEAQALVRRHRTAGPEGIRDAIAGQWEDVLDVVQVRTPDRSLDILLNDWLLYQALACRIWGRTAGYQSSGAYGFRDQLQDVMSLCVARPDLARAHLLRSARRQFVEGDVQHWWLPPSGKGLRTRMSDDRLWLPYVAAHYVTSSGDTAVLDERVPFIAGAPLEEGQEDAFFEPATSDEVASLYEHGARAIDVSLALGAHDLPLIGTGDWNDGMNRVGEQGRGESTWLAWFLIATINAYAGFAEARGEHARLARWSRCRETMRTALEKAGWDGAWYRRGYYDDGTPLGSSQSDECRIDAIAQSWSAMVEGANPDHVAQAMESSNAMLVREDDGVAPLFTPPFDKAEQDPGYIKGYPPGLRENGGQYTHGAIWSVFAFARLGQGDRAGRLFSILNPIRHAATADAVVRYKVEPYVACADVYSVPPHVGRGGWTWYTGSAAWLYRAGLEAILGFRLQGDTLLLDPCIPASWPGFDIAYRHGSARYEIRVDNPLRAQGGVAASELDGEPVTGDLHRIVLRDDGATHRWKLTLGTAL